MKGKHRTFDGTAWPKKGLFDNLGPGEVQVAVQIAIPHPDPDGANLAVQLSNFLSPELDTFSLSWCWLGSVRWAQLTTIGTLKAGAGKCRARLMGLVRPPLSLTGSHRPS